MYAPYFFSSKANLVCPVRVPEHECCAIFMDSLYQVLSRHSIVVCSVPLGDWRALEEAIHKQMLCESTVQCTLLQTMSYMHFKKSCLETQRTNTHSPVSCHLTPELMLQLNHGMFEVHWKRPKALEETPAQDHQRATKRCRVESSLST